jgi:hypothetical protein
LTDAISLYEATLADRERVLGPDHPDTLRSSINLASALVDMQQARPPWTEDDVF